LADKKAKTQGKGKEAEHGPDFKFIVRMANTDIDGERRVKDGLTSIKGISYRISQIITTSLEVPREKLIGDLTDAEIERLNTLIEDIPTNLPQWMLNRQRDLDTGEDTHAISTDLDITAKDDINLMRKIKCYKGVRHETGQKVRGQRSKSNGRTGATIGVSRKKATPTTTA